MAPDFDNRFETLVRDVASLTEHKSRTQAEIQSLNQEIEALKDTIHRTKAAAQEAQDGYVTLTNKVQSLADEIKEFREETAKTIFALSEAVIARKGAKKNAR